MRTDIPAPLQSHLDSRETTLCWCWRITKKDGTVLGFTNHDRDLTFDSYVHKASTGFLGTEIESQLGMSVDNMDVYGAVDSDQITEADISRGLYDNAEVEIYLVNWRDVSQRVIMKKGNLGRITRGKTLFEAELRGLSQQLQNIRGRLYQYTCDAQVGDSRCGVNLNTSQYRATGAVISTDGSTQLEVSGLSGYSNEWFSYGIITFTSGDNNGFSREVKGHYIQPGAVSIFLWQPMAFPISPGDDFFITAGCNKTFKTCKAKFNNQVNFRGFPHIPGTKTIFEYAQPGQSNFDGGGRFVGKD